MKTTHSIAMPTPQDEFGRRVAARLTGGSVKLPHEVQERLKAARVQAMARRKLAPRAPAVVMGSGSAAVLGGGWWARLGAVIPLVALAAGLVAVSVVQDERRANELAEVDSALLTDELPPAAYTDPGFAQFLKADAVNQR